MRELAIEVHTISHEILICPLVGADHLACDRRNAPLDDVVAAEELPRRTRLVHANAGRFCFRIMSDIIPSDFHGFGRAGHLEVVDINREKALVHRMPEATAPIGYGYPSNTKQMLFAVALPVAPRSQRQLERANWVNQTSVNP